MTTNYVVMCFTNSDQASTCESVSTSLPEAKSKLLQCITHCVQNAQALYPTSNVISKLSDDGLASIVVMENVLTKLVDVNNTTYDSLSIVNTRQILYSKMYIVTVN